MKDEGHDEKTDGKGAAEGCEPLKAGFVGLLDIVLVALDGFAHELDLGMWLDGDVEDGALGGEEFVDALFGEVEHLA